MSTLSRVTGGMILITATIVGGSMVALAVIKKNTDGKSYEIVKVVQGKVGARRDGKFGNTTVAKVKEWQRRNRLTADGVVGEDTWRKMFGRHRGPELKMGNRGANVVELQKKLNRARGTGLVNVNGRFDEDTKVALQKYQTGRGIQPKGTLQSDSRYMMKWGR